jgi:hypothetical protein
VVLGGGRDHSVSETGIRDVPDDDRGTLDDRAQPGRIPTDEHHVGPALVGTSSDP